MNSIPYLILAIVIIILIVLCAWLLFARSRDKKILKRSEFMLQESQKVTHVGIFIYDVNTGTWDGSPEFYKILGIDKTPQTINTLLTLIHPDFFRQVSRFNRHFQEEKGRCDFEYKIVRHNDGAERWIHEVRQYELDQQGKPARIISVIQDITKRKNDEETILYLSYHDPLTGLFNRRFFEEEIKKLDTESNLPLSILFGDINGLKLINDVFGHAVGDTLLQRAAKVMKSCCRTDEIVTRWGGDEFVIVLPRTGTIEAEIISRKIQEQLSREQIKAMHCSISIGFATKSSAGQDILQVLRNAEERMYLDKAFFGQKYRKDIIENIMKTLFDICPWEEIHASNVSRLCQLLGLSLGLPVDMINTLRVAGYLHDIGKIVLEESMLNKNDELSQLEWYQIKQHPIVGYKILSLSNDTVDLAHYILNHHERWDGSGYPKGLKGEEIPKLSRIIAIAESYDTMITGTPWRPAISEEEALLEVARGAGTHFEPELADLLIKLHRQ